MAEIVPFDDDEGGPVRQPDPMPRKRAEPERHPRDPKDDAWKKPRTQFNGHNHGASASRELPNNLQAEAGYLSVCLQDSVEVDRAAEFKVGPESFYSPAHRIVWCAMVTLRESDTEFDLISLSNRLRDEGELEAVGGVPFLVQLDGLVGTSAHVTRFLKIIADKHRARKVIRAATGVVERIYDGEDVEEVVTNLRFTVDRELDGVGEDRSRSLMAFSYPTNDPNVLLGARYRYVTKGSMGQIVAMAGSGKSSGCYQSCAMWACGRDFLGINTVRPMRIFIAQTEDDEGDVGEVVESVRQGLGLNSEAMEMIKQNVRIESPQGLSGQAFIAWLRSRCRKYRPDLVVLNPLSNLVGGAMSDDEISHEFCNGLEQINPDRQWAYIFWHHTPKPPSGEAARAGGPKQNLVWQYSGFGSSVWANRCRWTIIIEPRPGEEGRFWWHLAKRGRRAGVVKKVPHGAGCTRDEITTKIAARHSERRIQVNGTSYPMILWEEDAAPPDDREMEVDRPGRAARAQSGFPDDMVLPFLPLGKDNAQFAGLIHRTINTKVGAMSNTQVGSMLARLRDKKLLIHGQDGRYYRPTVDDDGSDSV